MWDTKLEGDQKVTLFCFHISNLPFTDKGLKIFTIFKLPHKKLIIFPRQNEYGKSNI